MKIKFNFVSLKFFYSFGVIFVILAMTIFNSCFSYADGGGHGDVSTGEGMGSYQSEHPFIRLLFVASDQFENNEKFTITRNLGNPLCSENGNKIYQINGKLIILHKSMFVPNGSEEIPLYKMSWDPSFRIIEKGSRMLTDDEKKNKVPVIVKLYGIIIMLYFYLKTHTKKDAILDYMID